MSGCRFSFVRFRDLNSTRSNVEMQIHTTQTDGRLEVSEILRLASGKGLSAIAVTEHVRANSTWFSHFVRQVRSQALQYPDLSVYVGCECKVTSFAGTLDISPAIQRESDLVLGSVHRLPDGNGGYRSFASVPQDELAQLECDLAIAMLRHAPIDVLAHPGGMYQRRYGKFPEHLFRQMMTASLDREVAIEINASYLVDVGAFIDLCYEINPYVSIGSDVHDLDDMGRCRDLLRDLGVGVA